VSSPTPQTSNYIWVESTFCKGATLLPDGSPGCDVKMISRSIDDRKRSAHYRQYYQEMKKKEAVNEAKLRYISCIAHDLKTPLQSFCFTVDLLAAAGLNPAQCELLEHANVAVDLMKLTISQTMDISKALTGTALQPRRQPVRLSSIIERVRVIM
jgi:signal transduction histidine kinase